MHFYTRQQVVPQAARKRTKRTAAAMAADIESSAAAKAGGTVRGGAEVGLAKTALKSFTRSFLEVGFSPFMRSIKVRAFVLLMLYQCAMVLLLAVIVAVSVEYSAD
jgi:hypothetical protein